MAPVSTWTVSIATGVSGSFSKCEVPVLQQQQGEGELSDILDHFLWTFEQHIAGCSGEARPEMGSQSYMKPNGGDTAITGSQTQPYVEESTLCRSHQRHASSVVSSAHTHCPVTNTPPLSPSLSSAPNSLQLAAAVRAVLPHLPDFTDKERDEEEERVLMRRQRRDRTGTPVQASAARLTKQPEREKADAKKPPSYAQPSKLSTPSAATLTSAHTTATIPSKQPTAPSRVRSRSGRPLVKRRRLYSGRKRMRVRIARPDTGDAETTGVCERGGNVLQLPAMCMAKLETNGKPPPEAESGPPGKHPPHSQQPIRTEPEFRGRTIEVKTLQKTKAEVQASPPSVDCPIRSLSDCNPPNKKIINRISYSIRTKLSDHHIQSTPLADEELPSWKHPLPDRQPTSTLEEVRAYPPQPMTIQDLKEATGVELRRGPGRPRKERPFIAPSGGESLKAQTSTTLTQPAEQDRPEEEEEREEEKRVPPEGEAGGPVRTGEKRRLEETEKERRTDATKRVCLEQVGLKSTTSKAHTSGSKLKPRVLGPQSSTQDVGEESEEEEEDAVVTSESEDEVELVSTSLPAVRQTLTGEGSGETERGRERDHKEKERKWEMDGDTERGVSSGEDVTAIDDDSDASGDVVGDDDDDNSLERMDEEEWHTHLQSPSAGERKTPALLHSAVRKPPASQASRSTREVSLGSTGSWDETEEEEVDVIGVSVLSPSPLPHNWGEWIKVQVEEEEREEEEIDVVGGSMG